MRRRGKGPANGLGAPLGHERTLPPSLAPDALIGAPAGHSAPNRGLGKQLRAALKLVRPKPPLESAEQRALAYWARTQELRYPALRNLTAMPLQGGIGKTHKLRAIMRQQEGTKAGYPDFLLDAARGGWHGLRIELKRGAYWSTKLNGPTREGLPTDVQLDWHARLTRENYLVWVCWGWEPARDVLLWYLTLPVTLGVGAQASLPKLDRARVYVLSRSEVTHD